MNAPPVIVRIPDRLGGIELLVRHGELGVTVDIRPADSRLAWQPISHWGGTFEVRAQ